MYIRRKVFSLLNVEGEDRYFSTTNYVNVGEGEVRLFSEKENKKKMSNKKKAAIAAGTVAGTAALVVGAKKGGAALRKSAANSNKALAEAGELTGKARQANARKAAIGRALEKPADIIVEGTRSAVEGIKRGANKAKEAGETVVKKVKERSAK